MWQFPRQKGDLPYPYLVVGTPSCRDNYPIIASSLISYSRTHNAVESRMLMSKGNVIFLRYSVPQVRHSTLRYRNLQTTPEMTDLRLKHFINLILLLCMFHLVVNEWIYHGNI